MFGFLSPIRGAAEAVGDSIGAGNIGGAIEGLGGLAQSFPDAAYRGLEGIPLVGDVIGSLTHNPWDVEAEYGPTEYGPPEIYSPGGPRVPRVPWRPGYEPGSTSIPPDGEQQRWEGWGSLFGGQNQNKEGSQKQGVPRSPTLPVPQVNPASVPMIGGYQQQGRMQPISLGQLINSAMSGQGRI